VGRAALGLAMPLVSNCRGKW